MRRKKDVTMQDIADYLSISKVTVSKALNGKDGVGKELKERILEVGRDLNYKMPENAVNLPVRPKNIAIFMKEKFAVGEAGFYLKFYQRISVELSKYGYFAHLFPVNQQKQNAKTAYSYIEHCDICGMILLGDIGKAFLKGVGELEIPYILVDFYDSELKSDCILTENVYSMYELTRHLIKCGHKDIGFVGTITATNSIKDRFLGYCRALIESGVQPNREWLLDDRNEDSEDVVFTLPEVMPTAFVCNCDDTAYQFVRSLKERGYRVPEDISIVSFDNDIYAELCVPKLTTAEVNIKLMARKSVELIRDKILHEHAVSHGVTFVNATLIFRDSVKVINETIKDER